ncbi:MAG TPA: FAD-dependent oxidoreductase [Candidatus Angelobacter sp.]
MKTVFVVGAGPAGLFAAQKIAQAGHQVVVFNRDIKPGGLAEYGIYPTKDKMKVGLRKQFAKVLSLPNVHYIGHACVGNGCGISIADLKQFHPSAIVFAVGAQGAKQLGLPGAESKGVYSAKDFVYFYNLLPPYASQDFSTGKRVAVVGMGNVAVDVAHWLLVDDPNHTAEDVIVIARRGPFEAKFDKKEFAYIEQHLDRQSFQQELKRIQDQLAAVGQDPAKLCEATFPCLTKPDPGPQKARLHFRFLSSPKAIHSDESGRIASVTVTENILVKRGEDVAAKATDKTADIEVDTMVFAVGDVADPSLGLPYNKDCYVTNPHPQDPKQPGYEVLDPQAGQIMDGIYVVGWARKASEGLVGIARHDGEVGAAEVIKYLQTASDRDSASYDEIVRRLESRNQRLVRKPDLELLAKAEDREGQARGIQYFKFSDDEAMLAAIEEQKSQTASV